ESFRAVALGDIDLRNESYRRPLEQSARALREASGPRWEVVLLHSVPRGMYFDLLLPIFGDRLMFPVHFVGRGDMSRGGLMLRCVMAGFETPDFPPPGALRHGG